MSLINANEITMAIIDNLITTGIKDIRDNKQRADFITTVTFINETRNDPIQPDINEETIEWLIKNGALINKTFNGHAFYHLKEKDTTFLEKNLGKSLNIKEDHLIDAHMKTPNHPSSIVTPLLACLKLNLSIACY